MPGFVGSAGITVRTSKGRRMRKLIIIKANSMSYMKDKAIDQMNKDQERAHLLTDIFHSVKMSRWEANYIPLDQLVAALDEALGDEAVLFAKKILNKHGM